MLVLRSIVCVVLAGGLSALATAAAEETFRMPTYADKTPPAPRAMAEVEALLAGSQAAASSDEPFRILLVAGPKDHAPGAHDYPAWQETWSRLLARAPQTQVAKAWEFPLPEEAAQADVIVFYQKGDWNEARADVVDRFLARGGGLVYIHWAVNGNDNAAGFAERIGLASKAGAIKVRHGWLDIDFSPGATHPVARNFDRVKWHDESYWSLYGDPSRIHLIGTSSEEGQPTPQFWTVERGRGRVFVSIPGHYMWTFDDPAFRLLLMRGIAWSGGRNIDRFNDLILLDARVE